MLLPVNIQSSYWKNPDTQQKYMKKKKNYTHTNVSSLHTYEDPGPPSSAAFDLWEKGRGKEMDAAQPGPP